MSTAVAAFAVAGLYATKGCSTMESARALMLSLQGMSLAAAHDAEESTDIAVRGVSGVTDRDAAAISTSPLRDQPQLLIPIHSRQNMSTANSVIPHISAPSQLPGRDATHPPLACDLPPTRHPARQVLIALHSP